ncbi:unnamed protein product [Soboliphyme baturini]|uniref:AcidPPc domain-containing protein n=1 Tax=Soboliphyme baturini TaxID=241478 RepID=A0A183IDB3_9BILA|nr:unnamed protein product [Soboliphyme baturini]
MVASAPYVDQFSFPSGHCSRALTLVTIFLNNCCGGVFGLRIFSLVYIMALALSRVVLGRHHISDVCFGCLIGWFDGKLIVRMVDFILTIQKQYSH